MKRKIKITRRICDLFGHFFEIWKCRERTTRVTKTFVQGEIWFERKCFICGGIERRDF